MMANEFQRKLHHGEIAAPWDHIPPAEVSPYKEVIASHAVTKVGRRPSLPRYVADMWKRRDFLLYDAQARVRTQNSQHHLGSFWLLGKPILDVAFYFIVFGMLLKVDRGIDNYAAYVTVGVLLFRYSSIALTQSPGILRANRAMIHAFSFPKGSLVLSFILREALAAGPLLLAVLIMIMSTPPHVLPSLAWLLVFPLLAIQTLFNLGIAFIMSRLAFGLPDIAQAMSFVSRVLMYGSGVIFPIERFISHPVVYDVMTGNPLFILLRMYRTILLDHSVPPGQDWWTMLLWSAGLTVFGLVFFWGAEEKYGRP